MNYLLISVLHTSNRSLVVGAETVHCIVVSIRKREKDIDHIHWK